MATQQVFKETLKNLAQLHVFSYSLARTIEDQENVVAPDRSVREATYSFIAAFQALGTILTILPGGYIKSDFKGYSFSVVASLIRQMMECLVNIGYWLENIDDEERGFRLDVAEYCADRLRLSLVDVKVRKSVSDDELVTLRERVDELWSNIENSAHFTKINRIVRGHIQPGRQHRVLSPGQIGENIGLELTFMKSVQDFLSQYTHITSYATQQVHAYADDTDLMSQGMSPLLTHTAIIYSTSMHLISKAYGIRPFSRDIEELVTWYVELGRSVGRRNNV